MTVRIPKALLTIVAMDTLGVARRFWLALAAVSPADPVVRRLTGDCDLYVDHYRLVRGTADG